jgi:tetratricopeptide (TPR) repeat protein
MIGGQLYLFESDLGLPFANEDGTQIATWEQVRKNSELLRKFDLKDVAKYKVTEADLKRVVPLVVASPEALSKRMLALERSLKGNHHLQLFVPARELAGKLAKIEGLGHARLWHVPWEAIIFQEFLAQARAKKGNEAAAHEYVTRYSVYDNETPLFYGRFQHIHGKFATEDQTLGALDLYLESRTSDANIRAMARNVDAPKQMPEIMQHAKEDATFFFGLSHYETGRYDLAAEWFERIIEETPDSPWIGAAHYNLGRSYEAQEDMDRARTEYIRDTDSPQRLGSILRAELLKSQTRP